MGVKDGSSKIGRKAGLGAIGITTIAGQCYVVSLIRTEIRSEVKAASHVQVAQIREDIAGTRLEREREFVRRADLERLGTRIDKQLDGNADRLEDLTDRIGQLEGYLKGRDGRDRERAERTALFWKRAMRRK